jgi:hypothetical protein
LLVVVVLFVALKPTRSRRAMKEYVVAKLVVMFLAGLILGRMSAMTRTSTGGGESSVITKNDPVICDPNTVYRRAGFRPVARRHEFGDHLQRHGMERGVEVGVQVGLNSMDLLTRWKSCTYLGLVDLWEHQENYNDVANVNSTEQESKFLETKKRLESWKDKTEFFRMYSTEAAKLIPDNSLDFVYVDARHDAVSVQYVNCWSFFNEANLSISIVRRHGRRSGILSQAPPGWNSCRSRLFVQ